MAHGFGELAKVHGIVTYKLSPFEQRAFAGAISKGVPNIARRLQANVFTVAPRKFHTHNHIIHRDDDGKVVCPKIANFHTQW